MTRTDSELDPKHPFLGTPTFQLFAAVLSGMVATPLIILLAERLPIISSVFIYGALSFFFAYLIPRRSWRWGCWVPQGIVLAVLLAILLGFVNPSAEAPVGPFGPHSAFIGVMAIIGYFPALAGSMIGAWGGAYFARQQAKRNDGLIG